MRVERKGLVASPARNDDKPIARRCHRFEMTPDRLDDLGRLLSRDKAAGDLRCR
jgi:hypothetical protein